MPGTSAIVDVLSGSVSSFWARPLPQEAGVAGVAGLFNHVQSLM